MSDQLNFDVIVIGSGAAGLTLALNLADAASVAVVSKSDLAESSTLYAQGGVSAVFDSADSIESHVADTLDAGAGLCRPDVVDFIVRRGRERVQWLIDQGVPFTMTVNAEGAAEVHLTREGGHSHRRVVHAADATGRAIETTLERRVRAHGAIALFEHHAAIDLITGRRAGADANRCYGIYVYDRRTRRVRTMGARVVVIASGGAGKVYLYTSNPDVATGDGIAMAWRAGCRVANMEFVQFHPTCLYHPRAKSFLISEALRGEGARLLLPDGSPFMQRFDPRGELAPRDIVARAIDHEMKRLGSEHVLLDISHKPADFIREHFPNVHRRCLEFGFDITQGPIPVVPAAHFLCGGVMTDLNGRTSMAGLYAIGEAACTGLHGANRMASNSLLECLVIGAAAAADIRAALVDLPAPPRLSPWDESQVTDSDEEIVVSHNWDELRRFMWDYVGIVRTTKRLLRARARVELLKAEIAEYYGNFRVGNDLLELRNLVQVAETIIACALMRRESRGLHFTRDFPVPSPEGAGRDTILQRTWA
ncbi:MAG: L-aspartate oxidase [Gammaproteobacteria bacterium]